MQFSGEIRITASREAVYAKLRDATFFASCVEGIGALEERTPTSYGAVMQTRIAYIRFTFAVDVELLREQPPELVEARVEGKPSGMVGRLTATSLATLAQDGAETVITYRLEAALTGRLGSLGQPVLKAKAREMEKQFAANLRQAFAPAGEETQA
jgi:carbon monoxide dehydrogenase subunit G